MKRPTSALQRIQRRQTSRSVWLFSLLGPVDPPKPMKCRSRSLLQWPKRLNAPLSEVDPELVDIIEKEKNRQWKVGHVPRLPT